MVNWFRKKKKRGAPPDFFTEYEKVYLPPNISKPEIASREFKLFKKKEKERLNWFELLANFSEKVIRISPDENTKRDLESAIGFTGLRVTATGVISLMILTIMVFVFLSVFLIVLGVIPLIGGLFLSMAGVGLSYYFLKYPINLVKTFRIKASSQVVLAILYIVVSMRISPNLEKALRFSAANISGELAWDMRRLIWDIEMGKYYSANDAMTDYISKWKPENEEFAEALRLVRDSTTQTTERGEKILDEALDVILNGTKTRMKHYAQDLRMPVMIIHMMGIILPVLGSIMAPMAAIFLSDVVRPEYFVIGYDVVLPLFLIWFINNTLKKRPSTFSQVDMSRHPDLPPPHNFSIKLGKEKRLFLPALPFAVVVGLAFILPAAFYFLEHPASLTSSGEHSILTLTMSCFITLGIGFGIASFFILSNFQRMRIQNDIQSIENEFELALFQLGNRISSGTPTELALEKSIGDVKDLKIAGLFSMTLRNIRTMGMTFKEALFHPKWGAILYYPSNLIKNIMYMIVDIAKKGVKYAAEGMLTISKYMKNIKETQEYIRDLLSESTSSMTFQAYMLTPMITGLIVSMSDIIIKVLLILGQRLQGLTTGANLPFNITGLFFGAGGGMKSAVSPEIFQLIVGIYLIEVIIILAVFLTKITQGDNNIAQWYLSGKMLIVALTMYFMIALGASFMFGELIAKAVEGIGV